MGASTVAQVIPGIVPVLDTSAYAANDLLFDTVKIPDMMFTKGRCAALMSVTGEDKSAQAAAFDLIFLQSNMSMGTINAAPSITDANAAAAIIGRVPIAATDYSNIAGGRFFSKTNIMLMLEAAADLRDIWVAGVNGAGTPTYGAAGDLVLSFGVLRY